MSEPFVPVVTTPVEPDTTVIPNVQKDIPNIPKPAPKPVAPVADKEEPVITGEPIPSDVTGNTALDSAISTFVTLTGAHSGDMDRAVAKAIEYGNVDLIDNAFLKERFGKFSAQAIELAKAAVQNEITKENESATNAKSAAYTAAGSEANWNKAVSVFNSTANPTIKAAVKALMNTGDVKAGAELVISTVNGSGLLPQTNPSLNGGSVSPGQAGALSSQQFQTELSALRKEVGNQSLESGKNAGKYNQLLARRKAGKQLGL